MLAALIQHPFMSQSALAECNAEAMVQAMLAFELALAEVQEVHGAVPEGASREMRHVLDAYAFDVDAIAAGVASGGNAAIPFVKQGRAALPDALKRFFHQGATSQDVVDSALMLLLMPRLAALDALLLEGALEQAAVLLEGMEVHPEAMRRNLATTGGGIMAEPVAKLLAPTLGPGAAKRISAEAAEAAGLHGIPYASALNAQCSPRGAGPFGP
ncbi:hypothetical protein ACR80S_16975 [Halomonas sp. MA07-2]|uniref:hypothetical protein n=1 Tax=Halomonas sp. MA07-2 TaxID=3440841 RepID=UPI003EEB817E